MSAPPSTSLEREAPAIGEWRARWGYGYQDKVATERILDSLRKDLHDGTTAFEGVRLADPSAGRVDDFVLVWNQSVEANSIKWSGDASGFTWGELVGASGLLRDLANGWRLLQSEWPGHTISVRLQTNRPASANRHHAQLVPSLSVAEFVATHWLAGPDAADSVEVREAWRTIAEHVRLSGPALSNFVAQCELAFYMAEPPIIRPDSLDSRHYRKQFDSLHKAIATWLTNNPEDNFIRREYLLEAIGLRPSRSGLIQRFPEPQIPYERNHDAGDRLKELVDAIPSGYLAVTGPAGVGKSTLVQDVLTDSAYPFFVPYYAFLPSTEGNRDRAEALTFFQDVVARLDRFGSERRSLGVTDLSQGRDALRHHMSRANERYVLNGQKTILLIDGLDHAMREVSLQAPMLQELPRPSEIPEGFVIILSGQPQAFGPKVIPPAVAAVVGEDSERVEVSNLSRQEVHNLVSKFEKRTTGPERDALHEACLGNPLILTYLLAIFERTDDTTVNEAIELAGDYAGDMDKYYKERLSEWLQDGQTRKLLGLLCRAAPTLPIAWLDDWPEGEAVGDLYRRVLAPFVRVEDGQLQFIHNSLIAFLKSETRSRLPTSDPAKSDRKFYSILADRSIGRSCIDRVGRARVVYLMRAGRHSDVLEQVSSAWVRSATYGFLPFDHVRPLLLAGHAAASATEDWGHTLRLVLLSYELGERSSRVDAVKLANALLDLDRPMLALSRIRFGGRLLVDESDALEFAGTLWWYAHRTNRADLKAASRTLYLQAKPISRIYSGEPTEAANYDNRLASVRAWSRVAVLFERPSVVSEEIQRIVLTPSQDSDQLDPVTIRAHLLFSALGTAIDAGLDLADCQAFIAPIQALGPGTWCFAAQFRLAEARPSAVNLGSLLAVYEESETDDDLDLAFAWFLNRHGEQAAASKIVRRLDHIRFEPHWESHSWRFSDVTYTVRLRWLQEILGVPEGVVPGATDERGEACVRAEQTGREIGYHLALAEKGQVSGDRHTLLRSLLLFHNRPVHFDAVNSHGYTLWMSRNPIYEQVSMLAKAMGASGLGVLRDVVVDLTSGPTATQFTPHQRRHFAQLFYEAGTMSRDEAVSLGLSSTADAEDDEPIERQEACLKIATFLHSVGAQAQSEKWIRRASEVSAGAGSHKDYHMEQVAEWLNRSITHVDPDRLVVLERFARGIEVGGGSGASDGAATILRSLVRHCPARSWQLAVEFVERDVIVVSHVLEALIAGGANSQADPELLLALYCELLSLIAPSDTSETAVAILEAIPPEQKRSAAKRLMSCVRTNSLPSHRASVGRALEDVIQNEGISAITLTAGLKPEHDDSSQSSSLYRLVTGDVETLDQIAERLSDPNRPDAWNPNPEKNTFFSWWAAIGKASIHDKQHFDSLVASFPPSDPTEIEVMVRKADFLPLSEIRGAAKDLAEQAITRSKDGSWHRWLDGAPKVRAFRVLKQIDHAEGIDRARKQFSMDLCAGKVTPLLLLSDIGEILDLLEVAWPGDAVLEAVDDYLAQVLAASPEARPYESLKGSAPNWSVDQTLCRFVSELLAFPVDDVGVAARRTLVRYTAANGKGLVALLTSRPWWNPLQLEHLLAAVHVGSARRSLHIANLRGLVESLNHSQSLAIRSVAKRICNDQGWIWEDVTTAPTQPVVLLSSDPTTRLEADMVLGGDTTAAWNLHPKLILPLLDAVLDENELQSDLKRVYWELEGKYPWTDEARLKRWVNQVLARFWLRPRTIIGREAAMRTFGKRSLTGQIPPGAEAMYDAFYPIYDPELEMHQPTERPLEFKAMEWRYQTDDRNAWYQGSGAREWSHYPESVQGLSLIGERTLFVRPDWESPREERYRGLMSRPHGGADRKALNSAFTLTYKTYLEGEGQDDNQLIILNSERQLRGPAYQWAAINSNFARALGWHPSTNLPFQWLDASGNMMVESTYWKDGWIRIKPPRSESLGEGWFVSATPAAIRAIRPFASGLEMHLWVERHSRGERPYEGSWHLSRPL